MRRLEQYGSPGYDLVGKDASEYLDESNQIFNMLNKGHLQIVNGKLVKDSTRQ